MKLDNLKKLIAKVEKAEANIENLKLLMSRHALNCSHKNNNAKLMFSVYGTRTELTALSVDDSLMSEAINTMIDRAIELNAKDKQMIEAIELMVNPEIKAKPHVNSGAFPQAPQVPQMPPSY